MLKLKEQESLKQLHDLIQSRFINDESGHDFDHIQRVVNHTTLFLASDDVADPFITLAIAYLHDVYDHKIQKVDNVELALLDFMANTDIDYFGKETMIAKGASQIGFSIRHSVKDKLYEAHLVSDADYMDAIGSYALIRTFQYGILHDHSVDQMVEHLPEKLLLLKDLMFSPVAQEMATKRHQLLLDFYELYQEDKV